MTDQPSQETPVSPKAKTSSFGLLILSLVVVILIAAVAFGAYVLMHTKLEVKALQQEVSTLPQQVDQQLQVNNQAIQKQQATVEANQAGVQRLLENVSSNHDEWLLNESRHLIQTANITLNFEHNVPVTISLLKTADKRLFGIGDPNLYPVRKHLADDIAALQAVPKVDVAGLYLKLQALQQQTIALPLVANKYTKETTNNLLTEATSSKDESVWDKSWHHISDALGQVLVIRRREVPLTPLVSPKQHFILSQNVYLLYSQAQWAALHRNQAVYVASLKQVNQLVRQYFVTENSQTQNILEQTAALQKVNVSPVLPNITDSLAALKVYSKVKEQQMLVKNKPAKKTSSKKVTVKHTKPVKVKKQ